MGRGYKDELHRAIISDMATHYGHDFETVEWAVLRNFTELLNKMRPVFDEFERRHLAPREPEALAALLGEVS